MLAVNLLPRKGYYQKDEDDISPCLFGRGLLWFRDTADATGKGAGKPGCGTTTDVSTFFCIR